MNELLINDKTQALINSFLSKPSSALIIEGSEDSGAYAISTTITESLLGKSNINNILLVQANDGNSIGVEKIRELKRSLTTAAGDGTFVARVAVVQHAEKMTLEAQNSLLKLLEEPAKGTLVMLLAERSAMLLETVRSRCQIIKVLPITKQQALDYAKEHTVSSEVVQRAFLISSGNALLFLDVVQNKDSKTSESIALAKNFIAAKPFDRLKQQKELTEGSGLEQLLKAISLVAEAGLHGASPANRQRWKDILVVARHCETMLKKSTSPKLVYLYVSTEL